MKRNTKHGISAIVVISFALLALGSLGPDGSTNLNVAVDQCAGAADSYMTPHMDIHVIDQNSEPISVVVINAFVTYQKVVSVLDCSVESVYESYTGFTNENGDVSITLTGMHMDNKGDLVRVELHILPTSQYTGYWDIVVFHYGGTGYYSQVFDLLNNGEL